ncbi:MAG: hypothetical protein U9N63_03725 [Pseudomonadota bacterium]|nr:hypothetical protein [Pseudomonadota bacterium]
MHDQFFRIAPHSQQGLVDLPLKSAGHQAEQRFMVNKDKIVVQFELFIDFRLQLKKAGLPFFRQPGY